MLHCFFESHDAVSKRLGRLRRLRGVVAVDVILFSLFHSTSLYLPVVFKDRHIKESFAENVCVGVVLIHHGFLLDSDF